MNEISNWFAGRKQRGPEGFWWSFAITGLLLAVPLGWAGFSVRVWPTTVYIILIDVLVAFMVALGVTVMGTAAGVVVNARNCVSLSKLQIAAWTVVVIAALAAGTIWNMWIGVAQPLDINIPNEVLEALGISAASFIAAPALLSIKGNQSPAQGDATDDAKTLTATPDPNDAAVGALFAHAIPAAAQWTDMLRGDDLATARQVDLSKVQQLLVTALLIAVYGIAVWNTLIGVYSGHESLTLTLPVAAGGHAVTHAQTVLAHCQSIGFAAPSDPKQPDLCKAAVFTGLPDMDPKFVWLLAISHAGYLGYKTIDHQAPDKS